MKRLWIDCEEGDFSSLTQALKGEFVSNCDLACEVLFVDEEEIQRLNREQRNIDKVTDVLSFPTMDGIKGQKINKKDHVDELDEDGRLFIGSIVVCTKRAQEQAEEYGHGYEREKYYLITHGICHLLGYDHIEDADRAEMREKEERILKRMGITRD